MKLNLKKREVAILEEEETIAGKEIITEADVKPPGLL